MFEHSLGPADSLEMIAAQEFRFGYRAAQPPLFTWLLWAAGEIFGHAQFSLQIVKYGLLFAAGLLFYRAGRLAIGDAVLAAIGSVTTLLMFNVGLSVHDQSTHSVALITAIAGLLYGYALLAHAPTARAYIVIALAMLAGFLSKHSFAIVAVAVPLAFVLDRSLRGRIVCVHFALMLGITLLLLTPFGLWMLENRADAASRLTATIYGRVGGWGWLGDALAQLRMLGGIAVLILPLIVTLLVAVPSYASVLARVGRMFVDRAVTGYAIVLVRAAVIGTLLVAAGLLASDADRIPSRHLLMIVLPLSLGLVWLLPLPEISRRALLVILAIVGVSQTGLIVSRIGAYATPGKPFCTKCHHLRPVTQLAEVLANGGMGSATIVVDDPVDGGNLVPALAMARIVFPSLPKAAAPSVRNIGQASVCILLRSDPDAAVMRLHPSFGDERRALPLVSVADRVIKLPRRLDGAETYTWYVYRLAAGDPLCTSS